MTLQKSFTFLSLENLQYRRTFIGKKTHGAFMEKKISKVLANIQMSSNQFFNWLN